MKEYGELRKQESELRERTPLPPLPFSYEQTHDPKKAAYRERRALGAGKDILHFTDAEILAFVKEKREERDWFTAEYWRKKGMPFEHAECVIGTRTITLYNYNFEKPLSDEHIERMIHALREFTSRFPEVLERIEWILIDDYQLPSEFGDPQRYPTNGRALSEWRVFQLYPRGMNFFPHRITRVSNFEGTLAHELGHFIQHEFIDEWGEKFLWAFTDDYPDEWEHREVPDGSRRPHSKKTGEMAPRGLFPLQPEQYVNYYARQSVREDIAESIAAYIYDPEFLKRISPEKFAIIERHDAKKSRPKITVRRRAREEIALPEIKQEIIRYFIAEPES